MTTPHLEIRKTGRAWMAGAAAALLVGGVAWRGMTALAQGQPSHAETRVEQPAAPPVSGRAGLGARDSYADIVKVVAPAVVTIRTEGKARVSPTALEDDSPIERFFGAPFEDPRGGRGSRRPRQFMQHGLGSGVIVTSDGYILTNNHVVDEADDVRVDLTDGRTLKAKVVGTDKASDLALLKVEAADLHTLPVGNSDATQVGDVVLAVGNPLGVGQTVTMGIISAKGRQTEAGDGSYQDFIQTDAPINQGNSGGALVNTKGELIGINSQIVSNSQGNIGIGFAIPAKMAKHVMDELRDGGHVRRAQLGVVVQPFTTEMAESLGVKQPGGAIVASVEPGSAAERAGVKRGDVIKSFAGEAVSDTNSLRNHVADTRPGTTAAVVVLRDGSERTLQVKLDETSASKSASRGSDPDHEDKAALGITVAPLTADMAARVGAPRDAHGVLVRDVDPEGRAADAGIQPGDVIQEVNRQAVQNVDDLRAAVRKSADRPTLLLVSRAGRDLFVTVRPS